MPKAAHFIATCAAMTAAPAWAQGGINLPIQIENSPHQCVNVNKNAVTIYITSIIVEKKGSLFSDIRAVGVQSDVTLASPGDSRKFPIIRRLNASGIQDGLITAGVAIPLLVNYNFDPAGRVTTFEAPISFIRTKGDSKVARYARALLQVAQNPLIPSNPFIEGFQMVGNLSTSFLQSATEDEEQNISTTDMQISHALSRTGRCGPNDLFDGVHVIISSPTSRGAPGIIDPANSTNYCFYLDGVQSSRVVRYSPKTNNVCSKSLPGNSELLKNPQIVYSVTQITPAKLAAFNAQKIKNSFNFDSDPSMGLVNPSSFNRMKLFKDKSVKRTMEICAIAGVSLPQCFGNLEITQPED